MRIVNPVAIFGEDAAADYLVKKGYRIIERNFRKGYAEIDLIAIQSGTRLTKDFPVLVFIEVKTRTSNAYGTPFEGIAPWKVANLVKTAQLYKLMHPDLPEEMRIDAIGVYLGNNGIEKIEHVENISGF